jgi:hypothetical protein
MSKVQDSFKLHGKTIYLVTTFGGWSIIIMDDNIVLDNYHEKGGHIHPDPENHPNETKIKHDTQEENTKIVINHINKNKGLILKELIKELI